MTTDGTVTRIIEAYAAEPVGVVKLAHVLVEPGHPGCPELGLGGGESLLRRSVLLRGRHSGTTFLYAEALIAPDRLPIGVRDGLLLTDTAIGPLLADHRVETWREIVATSQERANDCASYFGISEAEHLLVRTYRVFSQERPIMAVTEKFPSSLFV